MRTNIVRILFIAFTLSACNSQTKSNDSQKDSSLFLNEYIQLGDSALNLVGKGVLTPDVTEDSFFNLMDKSLGGVAFETARATCKDGLINGLFYISRSTNEVDSFQVKVGKLFSNLCAKYGKPVKDSTYVEREGDIIAKHYEHIYEWRTATKVVSVTMVKNELYALGGGEMYIMRASVGLQDSIVKKHNLTNLFYK